MKEIASVTMPLRWWQPRNPGWWALTAMLVAGAVVLALAVGPAMIRFPVATAIAVVLSGIIVLVAALLIRPLEIVTRIGVRAAVAATLWGALVATAIYALSANAAIITMLAQHVSVEFADAWGAAIAAPLTEETGKLLGVAAVVIAGRGWLRGPMDGFILGAWVGLGFSVVEDLLYGYTMTVLTFEENEAFATMLSYILRAGLFWPISHIVFSAIAGAGLGFLCGRPAARHRGGAVTCLVLAYGLHALWNSPLLPSVPLRMLVAAAVPFLVWLVVHQSRRAEYRWYRVAIAPEVDAGHVPARYADMLAPTLWSRLRHRRRVVRAYGTGARQPQRDLEAALVDVADAADAAAADGGADTVDRLQHRRAALSVLLGGTA